MKSNHFKTMRTKVSWTLMTICFSMMSFCITACGGNEDSPILPDNPATDSNEMTVTPDTLYLKADGTEKGTFMVKLQKTASFFAKAEKDWCKLDNADGSGKTSYTVSVAPAPNTQTEDRTSRISFYSGEHTEYAYVVQKAVEKARGITITPDTLYLDGEIGSKGTVTVHLIDNSYYELGITNQFDREVIEEDDGKVLKINYTVKREEYNNVWCQMGVKQYNEVKRYYVCQKAKKQESNDDKYNVTITPDAHDVEAIGGEVFSLIDLDNKSAVTVTSDAAWCIPQNGNFDIPSSKFKLYIRVYANVGDKSRTATVTVKVGSSTKTCTVTQQGGYDGELSIGGYVADAVDLGLSVKWASHNLGASSQDGSGTYLAWGELKQKNIYSNETYAYYNKTYATWTNIGNEISGTQYDAAKVHWGDEWRMPTKDEMQELMKKCTWEWTQINKVNGYRITGPNGKSIFIPAAGQKFKNNEIPQYNEQILLWTGTQFPTNLSNAYAIDANSAGAPLIKGQLRDDGYPIRPVTRSDNTGQAGEQAGGGIATVE